MDNHNIKHNDRMPSTILPRLQCQLLMILIALAALTLLLVQMRGLPQVVQAGAGRADMAAGNAGERCFATPDDGATVFSSVDAAAVQQAVNVSAPGGTVKVAGYCAGVQVINGLTQTAFISTELTVAGGYTTTDWLNAGPNLTTTLDATGAGRVIFMDAEAPLTLTMLSIINGHSASTGTFACPGFGCGGGVFAKGPLMLKAVRVMSNTGNRGGGVHAADSAQVISSYFYNNIAPLGGGGGLSAGLNLTLSNTRMISNSAGQGGGAEALRSVIVVDSHFERNVARSAGGGGLRTQGGFQITGTTFISNTAQSLGGGAVAATASRVVASHFEHNQALGNLGGGVDVRDDLTISNTTFLSNTAAKGGGGASAFGPVQVINSRFEGNRTESGGGGLLSTEPLTIDDTIFRNNFARFDGGGVRANQVTIRAGHFEGNRTFRNGGGLLAASAEVVETQFTNNRAEEGGGIFATDNVTVHQSRFAGNDAEEGNGGAIFTDNGQVSASLFLGNRALNQGGGVWIGQLDNGRSDVVNTLFARNHADSGQGHALYLVDDADGRGRVRFTTIFSPTSTGGNAILAGNGTVEVANTIIAGFSTGISSTAGANVSEDFNLFFANGSDTAGVTQGGNSRAGDPAFANPGADDYHLTAASAAVNVGTDIGVTVDFEDDARSQAEGPDIGFDESPFAGIPAEQFRLSINRTGTGSGVVTGIPGDINCGLTCTTLLAAGTQVTLTATSAAGSSFAGWSGDLTGNATPKAITLDVNKSVTATFTANTPGGEVTNHLYLPLVLK